MMSLLLRCAFSAGSHGPALLARFMDFNEAQEAALKIVFRFADQLGLLILDLEDLQAMLTCAAEHVDELAAKYGDITAETVGTIQRQLLTLDNPHPAMSAPIPTPSGVSEGALAAAFMSPMPNRAATTDKAAPGALALTQRETTQ